MSQPLDKPSEPLDKTPSESSDKIPIRVGTNREGDDLLTLKAIEEAIRRIAAQRGISIGIPGAIDPEAKENTERAQGIIEEAGKEMAAYTAKQSPDVISIVRSSRRETVAELEIDADGRIKQRVNDIREAYNKLSVNFQALFDLIKEVEDAGKLILGQTWAIAVKVVKWAGALVGVGESGRSAVLDIPMTDFELSVRTRNCFRKMNIRVLGDLLKVTEAELLACKNFGQTNLSEIKQVLAAKGLRLGQALEDAKGGAMSGKGFGFM